MFPFPEAKLFVLLHAQQKITEEEQTYKTP